jgi:hypothetical protein
MEDYRNLNETAQTYKKFTQIFIVTVMKRIQHFEWKTHSSFNKEENCRQRTAEVTWIQGQKVNKIILEMKHYELDIVYITLRAEAEELSYKWGFENSQSVGVPKEFEVLVSTMIDSFREK